MKVLIIQPKMLGDVMVSSIIARHVKEFYEEVTVHFLVNEGFEDVLENNPYIDKIILFSPQDDKSISSLYTFLKRIHAQKYDIVLDVYSKILSTLIAAISRAKIRISFKKWYTSFFYTHAVDRRKQLPYQLGLAINHRLLLLKPIIEHIKNPLIRPRIYISETEEQQVSNLLKKNCINEDEKMVMVGVLGSEPSKSYPLKYMAKILDNIVLNRPDLLVILNFMPSQQVEVDKLLSYCKERTVSKIQKKLYAENLRMFLALLSRCKGLISNEGGAVNMAKALELPTFSIHSPWISKQGWHTFYLDTKHQAVHLIDFAPELFQKKSKKQVKKMVKHFYSHFKPEYFLDSLKRFLQHEV